MADPATALESEEQPQTSHRIVFPVGFEGWASGQVGDEVTLSV